MTDFWNTDVYSLYGRSVDAIMSDIENMLDALYSNFSKSSTPSNSTTGSQWYDTGTTGGFYNGMKFKSADGNWYKMLTGNASFKIWAYRNAALEGWVVDGTITDAVIALKGAGGSQYTAAGGNPDGTWTASGLSTGNESATHTHSLSSVTVNTYHRHGKGVTGPSVDGFTAPGIGIGYLTDYQGSASASVSGSLGTQSANHTHTVTSAATWRPKAAVGVMLYPLSPS